jgi:thioester reductase-like protein
VTTLLTGATGYLGSYLTHDLLGRGEPVVGLVRADDPTHARERLWRALQLHTSAEDLSRHLRSGALRFVLGDLRRPALGLAPRDADALLAEVDSVLHVAASLNRRSSRVCFDVNLRGGLEALLLGRRLQDAGRLRRFSYVSTVAVAGKLRAQTVGEDQAVDWGRSDHDPYARTKKLGEHQLARLLPDASTLVLRPSIVLGDSRFSETTQFDMALAFVRLAQCPALPFDPRARLDIVPADFVSGAIADLHLAPAPRHSAYHLAAGEASPSFAEVARALSDGLGWRAPLFVPRAGRGVGGLVRALSQLGPRRVAHLASLLDVFWPYLEWDVVFDNQRVVEETGRRPAPFGDYCAGLLRFARDGGFRYPYRPLPAALAQLPERTGSLALAVAG